MAGKTVQALQARPYAGFRGAQWDAFVPSHLCRGAAGYHHERKGAGLLDRSTARRDSRESSASSSALPIRSVAAISGSSIASPTGVGRLVRIASIAALRVIVSSQVSTDARRGSGNGEQMRLRPAVATGAAVQAVRPQRTRR